MQMNLSFGGCSRWIQTPFVFLPVLIQHETSCSHFWLFNNPTTRESLGSPLLFYLPAFIIHSADCLNPLNGTNGSGVTSWNVWSKPDWSTSTYPDIIDISCSQAVVPQCFKAFAVMTQQNVLPKWWPSWYADLSGNEMLLDHSLQPSNFLQSPCRLTSLNSIMLGHPTVQLLLMKTLPFNLKAVDQQKDLMLNMDNGYEHELSDLLPSGKRNINGKRSNYF